MNTFNIVIGLDCATKVPYATLKEAEEALADKRHGDNCRIQALVPYDEAVKIVNGIRTRKRTLYVAASQYAPSLSEPDHGYNVFAHVQVTRGGLLRYLDNSYTPKLRSLAAVEISLYSNCVFLGSGT